MYAVFGKRILDLFGTTILLFVALPILIIAAIQIFITMGRPIFFCQTRPGKNKIPFVIIKFRTMAALNKSEDSDEAQITYSGKVLRKFSIDELSQIINVLKGNMNLVGPRPLLTKYNDLFAEKHNKRFLVKPGITGWAQVNGRNQLCWDEKLKLDIYYVNHLSLFLDLKILMKTIWFVLWSAGFKLGGEDEKFTGNNKELGVRKW